YVQDNGNLVASGPFSLTCGAGTLENGTSSAGGQVAFNCNSLKLNHYQFTAGGNLQLNITNSLIDAGVTSTNQITTGAGFSLPFKPPVADLLGTAFQTEAPDFIQVNHIWAGEDRGAVADGYVNNAEIGKLIVGPAGNNPLFYFRGAGSKNGLYVDLLDLSNLGT